jgi:hypothetical protein
MKAERDSKFGGWMIHADGGILHRKQTSATAVHNMILSCCGQQLRVTIQRMNND